MASRRCASALWPIPCKRGLGYCIRPLLSPQLAPVARNCQGLEFQLAASRHYGGGAEATEKTLQILRKKMLYQARNRGDPLLADFLEGFVEAKGLELTLEDGESWAKLMECEEEKIEVPEDLNSSLLRRLQEFLAAGPPRKGLTGDSPWGQ
ncbi:unnamed protein product [Symbiodinium sp. KB8]|nr:unnamed protein product [Symbiodinium sp. KB8]